MLVYDKRSGGLQYVDDELYHYGVIGMKWGRRKASYKSSKNERLAKKAYDYDKKAAVLTKKSEKRHSQHDLEIANKSAKKSANYAKKAAKLHKKALGADDEFSRLKLERKATKLDYKSEKTKMKANRLSKTVGYGAAAMKYSIKSDKFKAKAAKARAKMASNKAYIEATNRKMSSLSTEELRKVNTPITRLIFGSDKRRGDS